MEIKGTCIPVKYIEVRDNKMYVSFNIKDEDLVSDNALENMTSFSPGTITLDIRTEEDLMDLYHRLNQSHTKFYENYDESWFVKNPSLEPKSKHTNWRKIRDIMRTLGLSK